MGDKCENGGFLATIKRDYLLKSDVPKIVWDVFTSFFGETKIISKQLAATEDLLIGVGKVSQQRSSGLVEVTKINASSVGGVLNVKTIDELLALDVSYLNDYTKVIVDDARTGGTFIYDTALEGVNNNVTVLNGWVRQLIDGWVLAEWYINPDENSDVRGEIQYLLDNFDKVRLPNRLCMLSDELKLNSYNKFKGSGEPRLKLTDDAPRNANVITTANNTRKDHENYITDIDIRNMIVDGNASRFDSYEQLDSTSGCGVGLVVTKGAVVKGVKAVNNYKHGFDISKGAYNDIDTGDPLDYGIGNSYDIELEGLEASNFGDDGITTHFCERVSIKKCSCRDHGNFYTIDNSNAFEIDDGSRYVSVDKCVGVNCSKGIQVKAHRGAPAAADVVVSDCYMEGCTQNYSLRHEGFDEVNRSRTASNVSFKSCVSVVPRLTGTSTLTPRHLAVQSYENVAADINCFGLASTRPVENTEPDGTETSSSIAFYSGARLCAFIGSVVGDNSITDDGFAIQINSTADNISIENTAIINCGGNGIKLSNLLLASIKNVILHRDTDIAGTYPIISTNTLKGSRVFLENISVVDGYLPVVNYDDIEINIDVNTIPKSIKSNSVIVGNAKTPRDVLLHLASTGADSQSNYMVLENTDSVISAGELYGGIQVYGNDASSATAGGLRASIDAVATGSSGSTALRYRTSADDDDTLTCNIQIGTTSDGLTAYTMYSLPTSDPAVTDMLWNDSGIIKISAG